MASDITPLASLSLTHVRYNPTDPLSLLAATLSLLPQALMIVYTTLLLATREAEVLLLLAGQLACEALNFVLKRLIRQDRPRHVHMDETKGYGMPSSHAQFAAFWGVSVGLFLMVRHRGDTPRAVRAGVSLVGLGVAAAVAWSRVYLGYHTAGQVAAGGLAGTVCAVAWFGVTGVVRGRGWLEWGLEVPVVRWLRVRDLVVEEDVSLAGWEKWEGRREVERRKREGKGKKGE